jgi:drug/metabolite transporter (DMT)-like permease
MKEDTRLQVLLLLFLLSIIWGSSFILIKRGLDAYTPIQLACLRVIFAFLPFSFVAVKHLGKISRSGLKWIFISGFFGIFLPAFLFAYAETTLSSSLTGILNALSPLFTIILAVFIFKHKFKLMQFIGLMTGFAGTIGLSFINSEGAIGSFNVYALLVVIATIFYALNGNIIKNYLSEVNWIVITSVSMLFIAPLALLILFFTDFISRVQVSENALSSLGYIALLGIFGTAIALMMYNRLIQLTSAVKASSVTYLIPIVAVLWGILDNENLYLLHYAGMALVLLGVYIVNRGKSE